MTTNNPNLQPANPTATLGDDFWRAVNALLEYCWDDEQRDYESRDLEDRAGHIFESLQCLKAHASTR